MDALVEGQALQAAALADWLTGRFPIPDYADSPMLRAMKLAAEQGSGRK